MYSLWKLTLRLLGLTVLGLAVAGGLLAQHVSRATPSPIRPEIFSRIGHSDLVRSVAWSPDGKKLASGSADNTLKLWDASSGNLLRTLAGHSDSVRSVAWSPDGRTLASGSADKTLKLWDVSSGNLLRTLAGHSDAVLSVAWSLDGKMLASGSEDNTLKLWDVSSGNLLRTLAGHSNSVLSVAWSPDGKTLASGSADKTLKLWDASSGNLLRTLAGHSSSVCTVAWSPDGKTLASGSADNTFKLWDASSGNLLRTLAGHSSSVWSVAWSLDGKMLASGSEDNTLKLWDASSGNLLRTLAGHSNSVLSVAWSPDGKTLASGSADNTIKFWDASSGSLLRTLAGPSDSVRSVAWSPDGKTLASGHQDGFTAVWQNTGDLEWLSLSLPGNIWLTYHPTRLFYAASQEGAELASIRFDSRTSPVYPLTYYRNELQRSDLSRESSHAAPPIKPKPFRLAWDRFENKAAWLILSTALYLVGFALVLVLAHRKNPLTLAQRFFSSAGSTRIQRISEDLLSLSRASKDPRAYVLLWQAKNSALPPQLPFGKDASNRTITVYVLYTDQAPEDARDQLRERLSCEVIPISTKTASIALSEGTSATVLREIEDRFATRVDPYDESKPVDDPTEFQGREDLLERLTMALKQGQHVGLFGQRKVGKTSLIKQLRNRAQDTPVVYIDCQASGSAAADYFQMILGKLRAEFERLGILQVPPNKEVSAPEDFREEFLRLKERWSLAGRSGPFLLLLDEIDKLFVDRRREGSEQTLGEYVRLLRALRAMAQEHRGLAVLVTSYRADVNRQNELTPSVGENPMFMSFQEYFLGAFTPAETRAMVEKIGAWKDIRWESDALDEVQELCGGHPFLTRVLASDACDRGTIRHVTLHKVRSVVQVIQSDYGKHKIGQYYKEAIWNELRDDERQALELIASEQSGLPEAAAPREFKAALTQLEHYGLAQRAGGKLRITARLLQQWIVEREYA